MLKIQVLILLAFSLSGLYGCGHVISKNLRAEAEPALTPREVASRPEEFKGKTVIWGGEIIETVNQRDRRTLIEVLDRALGWRGQPDRFSVSKGRFLVEVEDYLDPYIYRRGRLITVAGKIIGEKVKPIGQMDYHYPLILAQEIHLWPLYRYFPYYYEPWWSPWDYWWDYPYRWRIGIRYYGRH